MDDVYVYVPSINEIVMISEGSGENLFEEDTKMGIVDYLNYETYTLENGIQEQDGGMLMLTETAEEKYGYLYKAVEDVLELAYGNRNLEFTILEEMPC